ncbi:MAG: hypothetical protein R3D57_02950 [Hyphomicrobiaceae bacterium]
MRRLLRIALLLAVAFVAAMLLLRETGYDQGAVDAIRTRVEATLRPNATLDERIAEIGPRATTRLEEKFRAAAVAWPPKRVALLAFKDERVVELQAEARDGRWKAVHRYRVEAQSGVAGPKLREGDRQVPEGLYRVTFLNPNSLYHVSLRLDYPNAFDRRMGQRDGRSDLGGDIMIHGRAASIGCLAMGDPASEELFVLAHRVGLANVSVVIAPSDFRKQGGGKAAIAGDAPAWVPALYADIAQALADYP